MKKFVLASSLAIASSAGILMSSPAKAACVTAGPGTTQDCTVFNAQTTATTVDTFAYNDGGVVGSTEITGISFFSSILTPPSFNFTPSPITLTGLAYSLDGGTNYITTGINTSVALASNSFTSSIFTGGTLTVPAITANSFRLKFTIPGGLTSSNAGFLTAQVNFNKVGVGPQSQTRSIQATAFDTPNTSGVPSPLPLLGAGAAFGFSRKLRRRIAQFA